VVTFDEVVAGRTDIVLLHLGSQLVQRCLELLRAELWSGVGAGGATRLSRVTARVVPGDVLATPAVIAHMRVVVTGDEGTRLHEEVIVAGGILVEGAFTRARAGDLQTWLGAATL
jgi:hypothetical protein